MSKKQKHLLNLILSALLAATSVVLDRIVPSIKLPDNNISFGFLPILVCGMLCGPLWGGICGAVGDLVGAVLFPFGQYFPGFTATAFLTGLLYGICGIAIDRRRHFGLKLAASSLIMLLNEALCTLLINSYWLSFLYSQPYLAKLLLRLPQAALYLIIKTAAALLIARFVLPPLKKSLKRS